VTLVQHTTGGEITLAAWREVIEGVVWYPAGAVEAQ
jgi:hypothetical protein